MKSILLSWGMLIVSVIFNVWGVFCIKLRINDLGTVPMGSWRAMIQYFFSLLKYPEVISGLILFFIAPFLFAIALSRMDISVAYPVQISLNFVFLILLGFFVIGEAITMNKMIGLGLTFLSIYFFTKA